MFVGEMDEQDADRHYRDGMVLGTTLQVPAEMWPPDRAAFDRYWQEQLDKVHIDDTVRDYLYPIAVARMRGMTLPESLRRLPESLALLITTGILPGRASASHCAHRCTGSIRSPPRNASAMRCDFLGMPPSSGASTG